MSDMDMVTIPRAEYEALIEAREERDDIADALATRARIRAGEETFPAVVADRLLGGESPLRVFREYRGLTQTDLARASDVHRVSIADIEAGRSTGSVATLSKLADALGLALDDLA